MEISSVTDYHEYTKQIEVDRSLPALANPVVLLMGYLGGNEKMAKKARIIYFSPDREGFIAHYNRCTVFVSNTKDQERKDYVRIIAYSEDEETAKETVSDLEKELSCFNE